MSKSRYRFVFVIISLLVLGQVTDIITGREDWPWSSYSMYSGRQGSEVKWLRLFGVTSDGQETRLQADTDLAPLNDVALSYKLEEISHRRSTEDLRGGLQSLSLLYRRPDEQGYPRRSSLVAIRLYELVWKLNPELANLTKPDVRRLIYELRLSR